MRVLLIILLFSLNAGATDYYVSNAGSDGAAGTSTGTAWQTIAKVNAQTFSPGDRILFRCGDTWNEKLIVSQSGTLANPITYTSYSTGAKPIITGFQSLGGFTNVGNIWTATATNSVKNLNTVLLNGSLAIKARTPNTGWSTFSSSTYKSLSTSLSGTPNYTGAEVTVRVCHWVIDVGKITSQSGGTINVRDSFTYIPDTYGGSGYFIQNVVSALDTAREYVYDSTTKVLKVYATSSPTVKISTLDTLIDVRHRAFITIDGLALEGANVVGVAIDTTQNIVVKNCRVLNVGKNAIAGLKSPQLQVYNDSIVNIQSTAVLSRSYNTSNFAEILLLSDSMLIEGNYLKNVGSVAGMGGTGNGQYGGIVLSGYRDTIRNNRLDSIGYTGIYLTGQNSMIYRNYITNYCYVKDDGGGIYSWAGAGVFPADAVKGLKIRSNIIGNGIGATAGTTSPWQATGIYTEVGSRGVLIDSNTVYNGYYSTLFVDGNTDSNTYVYNTSIDSVGYPLYIVNDGTPNFFKINNNIFYSKSTAYASILMYTATNTVINNNYYSRPVDETTQFGYNANAYSLSGWQSITGYDANSTITPAAVTSGVGVLYTNPTFADSTVTLPAGYYIDLRSNYYQASVLLHPFKTVLLFPSTAPPALPSLRRRSYKKVISI